MRREARFFRFCLLVALSLSLMPADALSSDSSGALKPYRVLLVVARWADPTGQVIVSGNHPFQPVAALLKAWSAPFDILRLDQQTISAGYLNDCTSVGFYLAPQPPGRVPRRMAGYPRKTHGYLESARCVRVTFTIGESH